MLPAQYATLTDALARAAAEEGDRTYVHLVGNAAEEVTLTFGAVAAGARRTAQHLIALGLRPGDRVLVLLPTSPDFVFGFYGVQLAGGIPVPCAPPFKMSSLDKYLGNLERIVASSGAAFFLTTPQVGEAVTAVLPGGHRLVTPEMLAGAAPSDVALPLPAIDPETPGLIQYTSGAAGVPRGVTLSHRAICANLEGIGRALSLGRDDVAVSWLPTFADMGLIGVVLAGLYWRFPIHVMRPEAFLIKPHRWLEVLTAVGGTISVAPNFAYRLCTRRVNDKQLAGLQLSRWRVALNGAERVDPDTVREFEDRFGPVGFARTAFRPAYGLAESTLAVSFTAPDATFPIELLDRAALSAGRAVVVSAEHPNPARMVSIGHPIPGTEVAILSATGAPCPERVLGEIVVRGASLMTGYWGEAEATRQKIRDGWLRTGDQGYLGDGRLFITGRLKEMIIKRGRNYYPADIERLACRAPGLKPEAVAAFAVPNEADGTEDLVLLAETSDHADAAFLSEVEKVANTELLAGVGIKADIVRLVPPGTLVRNEEGTVVRSGCRQEYLQGRLASP